MAKLALNKVTAVVLAGGASSRMGVNKALLKLGDKTMIERVVNPLKDIFEEVIVVTNSPHEYKMLKDVVFIKDHPITEKRNSLIGLYSGLVECKTDYMFVTGCDMPFINKDLINYMANLTEEEKGKEKDVIIPFIGGHYQPLYAIYRKSAIPEFENLIKANRYKITDVLLNLQVMKIIEEVVKDYDFKMTCFENINTYKQYLGFKREFE